MDSSFERSTPKKRPTFSECTTELLSSSAMACGRDRWAGGAGAGKLTPHSREGVRDRPPCKFAMWTT